MRDEVKNKVQERIKALPYNKSKTSALETTKAQRNLREAHINWKFQSGVPSWKEGFIL